MVDRVEGFREVHGDCFVLMFSHVFENVLSEIQMNSITDKIQRKFIKLAEYDSLCCFLTKISQETYAIVSKQSFSLTLLIILSTITFHFGLK